MTVGGNFHLAGVLRVTGMGPDQGEEMSYLKDVSTGLKPFSPLTTEDLCFECGELITAGAVRYDGYATPKELKCLYLHPSCAAIVGQRLITDGYPNRR